jgi:hypothetical protein
VAHIELYIGETEVTLNDDEYNETYSSYEYTQMTEAGTTRRDTVRVGFLSALDITIRTDDTVKGVFDDAVKEDSLSLTIWKEGAETTWDCYMTDYKTKLIRDTATTVFWELSCTFRDLEES